MRAIQQVSAIAVALAIAAGSTAAQSILLTFPGDDDDERQGPTDGVGDLDGDGYADVIVGAPRANPGGRVRVFSGSDGHLLYEYLGTNLSDDIGRSVAGVGDVNGDGVPDFAYGIPQLESTALEAGRVHIRSGSDGALLFEIDGDAQTDRFGECLDGAGDVDGDGHADVIVGMHNCDLTGNNAGGVKVISGATGTALFTWYGDCADFHFGYAVAGIGDVDLDGFDDLAVGIPGDGGVGVFSGATGEMIHRLDARHYGSGFGASLDCAGDVDGDGIPDLVVGAPENLPGLDRAGAAYVYSGLDASLLFYIVGDAEDEHYGWDVAGVGDVNLDGFDDVLVGALNDSIGLNEKQGSVTLLSGSDGSPIVKYWGDSPYDYLGYVAGAGDVDADGIPDLLAGAWGDDVNGASSGTVFVFSGVDCTRVENYCSTSPNSVGAGAVMSHEGDPSVSGNTFLLICNGVPDGQFGLFFYGQDQGQAPFGNGYRCTAGQVFRLPVVQSQGGAFRHALDVATPPNPAGQITAGSEWNFQCWYRDPTDPPAYFNLSDGLNVVFCP